MKCHITAPHPRHVWTPLVEDPEDDHMLHIFRDAGIECEGVTVEEWRSECL